MSIINDIITGWSKLISDKVQIKKNTEAIRKMEICQKCNLITQHLTCNPNNTGTVVRTYQDKKRKIIKMGSIVSGCGCYLPAKVRSQSQCPLNKWEIN